MEFILPTKSLCQQTLKTTCYLHWKVICWDQQHLFELIVVCYSRHAIHNWQWEWKSKWTTTSTTVLLQHFSWPHNNKTANVKLQFSESKLRCKESEFGRCSFNNVLIPTMELLALLLFFVWVIHLTVVAENMQFLSFISLGLNVLHVFLNAAWYWALLSQNSWPKYFRAIRTFIQTNQFGPHSDCAADWISEWFWRASKRATQSEKNWSNAK